MLVILDSVAYEHIREYFLTNRSGRNIFACVSCRLSLSPFEMTTLLKCLLHLYKRKHKFLLLQSHDKINWKTSENISLFFHSCAKDIADFHVLV